MKHFMRLFLTFLEAVPQLQYQRKISAQLDVFRWCNHKGNSLITPCHPCRQALLSKTMEFKNYLPTSVNLAAVLSRTIEKEAENIRNITRCVSVLLRGALKMNCEIYLRFETKQAVSAKCYTALYRNLGKLPPIYESEANMVSTSARVINLERGLLLGLSTSRVTHSRVIYYSVCTC